MPNEITIEFERRVREILAERLPAALEANVSFVRVSDVQQDIRVTWRLPDGQRATIGTQYYADTGTDEEEVTAACVGSIVLSVLRMNRENLEALRERYGIDRPPRSSIASMEPLLYGQQNLGLQTNQTNQLNQLNLSDQGQNWWSGAQLAGNLNPFAGLNLNATQAYLASTLTRPTPLSAEAARAVEAAGLVDPEPEEPAKPEPKSRYEILREEPQL